MSAFGANSEQSTQKTGPKPTIRFSVNEPGTQLSIVLLQAFAIELKLKMLVK